MLREDIIKYHLAIFDYKCSGLILKIKKIFFYERLFISEISVIAF